jgi:hypothetical protein
MSIHFLLQAYFLPQQWFWFAMERWNTAGVFERRVVIIGIWLLYLGVVELQRLFVER